MVFKNTWVSVRKNTSPDLIVGVSYITSMQNHGTAPGPPSCQGDVLPSPDGVKKKTKKRSEIDR